MPSILEARSTLVAFWRVTDSRLHRWDTAVSVLQLSSVPSRSRLPDLVLRLLVPGPGPEHTNGRREEGYNLPQQTFLVEPKLPIVGGFDGEPSNDCTVLDMGLLAGVQIINLIETGSIWFWSLFPDY